MAAERNPGVNSAKAWRAVQTRDASMNGKFVYAVRTTGVYCKPSCASRQPRRENVEFFDAPDDAERAGYRACKRCEPRGEAKAGVADRARAFLDENADRSVSLTELASGVNASVSHVQREFKRAFGVSPREYQAAQRLDRFKSRLRAGDTVSRATYEAGFGSSSRVYEKSNDSLGMTPAAFRRGGAGERITYTIADAPLGRVLVATTDRGVCAVEIGGTNADVERTLEADFPNATLVRDDERHHTWVRAVLDRVRNPAANAKNRIPLDMNGSAFQQLVWKALQEIPAGERRTYREVAESIGRPTAARAVARACATNRIAVVVPCHRVVGASGDLSGYKWGVERKRRLLDGESA
jgi:AraC family transcriptional regulator of adaptative response/methylated-DNA-[protein]-cysteine methyltransferase